MVGEGEEIEIAGRKRAREGGRGKETEDNLCSLITRERGGARVYTALRRVCCGKGVTTCLPRI